MNNLKRILSLALAGVMTLGMMTVGASAAFDDVNDISNIAAVETTNALGIINGMGDNKFNPGDKVRRADAAVMIARALNGGETPIQGLATMYDGTFSDVKAEDYYAESVYYCYQANIIAGIGDGKFDPAGEVTGYQLAKMVLGALGYNASVNEKFAFVGANWHKDVMAFATNLKMGNNTISLFSGMPKCKPAIAMTRDEAAQIIYNGLMADTLDSSWNGSIDANGNLTYTLTYGNSLLVSQFNATISTGILSNPTYSTSTGKWTYKLDDVATDATAIDASDLFLNKVQIISNNAGILAISSLNGTVLTSGTVASYKLKDGELNGKSFDTDAKIYAIGNDTAIAADVTMPTSGVNAWDSYEAIDNNGNGKIDAIVVYPTTVGTVASVGEESISVNNNNTTTTYTYNNKDAAKINTTLVGEIAKGDVVTIVSCGNKHTMTKVELTEGVLVTAKNNATNVYTIGGKEYKLYNGASVDVGKSYDLGIVNGYVVYAVAAGTNTATNPLSNVLYLHTTGSVDEINAEDDGLSITKSYAQRVAVYFADGTAKTILVGKYNVSGTATNVDDNSNKLTDTNAGFYTFTEKDGIYTITKISTMTATDYEFKGNVESDVTTIVKGEGSSNGSILYADNGIFFVKYNNGEDNVIGVFTGAQINAWKADATIKNDHVLFYNDDNTTGAKNVEFGYFELVDNTNKTTTLPAAASVVGNYGYAVSDIETVYNAETKKNETKVTLWTGKENVTYIVADGVSIAKGEAYNYTVNGKGEISSATELSNYYVTMATKNYVTVNDGNSSKTYKLSDDTVVIYVKSADKVGATTGSIVLAGEDKNGNKVNNVKGEFTSVNGVDYVTALIVDVNNKMN